MYKLHCSAHEVSLSSLLLIIPIANFLHVHCLLYILHNNTNTFIHASILILLLIIHNIHPSLLTIPLSINSVSITIVGSWNSQTIRQKSPIVFDKGPANKTPISQ